MMWPQWSIDLWNSAVTFPSTGLRPKRFMKSTFDSWTIQGNRLALKPRPAAFRESAKASTGLVGRWVGLATGRVESDGRSVDRSRLALRRAAAVDFARKAPEGSQSNPRIRFLHQKRRASLDQGVRTIGRGVKVRQLLGALGVHVARPHDVVGEMRGPDSAWVGV